MIPLNNISDGLCKKVILSGSVIGSWEKRGRFVYTSAREADTPQVSAIVSATGTLVADTIAVTRGGDSNDFHFFILGGLAIENGCWHPPK